MDEWQPLHCGASVLTRDQFMFAIERMGLNLPPHMYEVGCRLTHETRVQSACR